MLRRVLRKRRFPWTLRPKPCLPRARERDGTLSTYHLDDCLLDVVVFGRYVPSKAGE